VTELSLLLIGRLEREMPFCVGDWAGEGVRIREADDLDASCRLLSESAYAPELIVLAQSRPGQYAVASLDALRRLAPLARIWRLLGSWCEGESRSGQPPSGCVNSYWHQWPARWARDAAHFRLGGTPAWALPVTLSADERTLAAAEDPIQRRTGPIAICTRHAQTAAALSDACRLGGYRPLLVREGQPAAASGALAVIWDADVERMSDLAAIRNVRACAGQAPLLALATFPRADDCRRAAEAGLAGVISKPFLVQDLLWHLARVANGSSANGAF
jgi:CheY-like chemotaxis protein